jgi:hypothetical protein
LASWRGEASYEPGAGRRLRDGRMTVAQILILLGVFV